MMSQANIPNITPTISITLGDTVNMLLASIALEEMGLANIMNAEAEKIQYVVGTLSDTTPLASPPTFSNLLESCTVVQNTLQDVIKAQMMLQFRLDNLLGDFPFFPSPDDRNNVKLSNI